MDEKQLIEETSKKNAMKKYYKGSGINLRQEMSTMLETKYAEQNHGIKNKPYRRRRKLLFDERLFTEEQAYLRAEAGQVTIDRIKLLTMWM